MIEAVLYDAQSHDREVTLDEGLPPLDAHQLLWIDLSGRDAAEIARVGQLLDLNPHSLSDMSQGGRAFVLANYGTYVHFDVAAIDRDKASGSPLKPSRSIRMDMLIGPGWMLTAHEHPLRFLQEFRDQDRGETLIGALTAAGLAASLLDWHLGAYLTALEDVEAFADRVDMRLLSASSVRDDLLQELVGARRYISSLRRSLAPQGAIFYGLSRPDVALIADTAGSDPFDRLEGRFERALDALEHGRSLVQSSFDLFTTRTAETTNNLIRRLTFISIMLGLLGGIAGVFGMNFETPYAKAGLTGFWTVVIGFAVVSTFAALVARSRRWI
jgi:Mg2+ and Co2+ transporter CorA